MARPLAAYAAEPVLLAIDGGWGGTLDIEQEVMRVTIPNCSPTDFFGSLFSDASNFQAKICKERGDDNFSCGKWVRTPTGYHTRVRKFESPYSTPMGELGRTKIVETQRAQVVGREGTLITVNTMVMKGVPYCDYYNIHGIFVITKKGLDIELVSLQAISWMKSTWLKSKITSIATNRAITGFETWRLTALPAIAAYALEARADGSTQPESVPSLEVLAVTPGKVYEVLGAGAAAGGSLAGADAAAAALDVSADQAKPLPRMPLPRMPSLAAAGFNADEAAMRWSVDAGGESWWTVPSPRKRKQASLDVFELVVVGDPKVGRTSLITSFCRWAMLHNGGIETANGGGERVARITLHSQDVLVQLLDPPLPEGQGGGGPIMDGEKADAAVVLYDTTDRRSFHQLDGWVRRARAESDPQGVVVVVGTKADLAAEGGRVVSLAEGEAAAGRLGARHHFEVSAETGFGVGQAVAATISDLLLGPTWEPELLAARQRLAWAEAAAPSRAMATGGSGAEGRPRLRLPLTVTHMVASAVPRCANGRVMCAAKRREAEDLTAGGRHEVALEAWAQVMVAGGPDDKIESCMRRAEAARWAAAQSADAASPARRLTAAAAAGAAAEQPAGAGASAGGRCRGNSRWSLWVDDSYSDVCFSCRAEFSFFLWRHHCRHCGHLFCADCSDCTAELTTASGERSTSRVCRGCHAALAKAAAPAPAPANKEAQEQRDEWEIERSAALTAAQLVFDRPESAVALVQYLQNYGRTVHGEGFLRRHRLLGEAEAVAGSASLEHWRSVVKTFVAELMNW